MAVITKRYSDRSVGVMHNTVCDTSKFTGTRMYFEKVGVALQRSNPQSHVKLTYHKGSTPGNCNSNRSMGMDLCKPVNGWILCISTHTKQGCGFHALADTTV